MHLEEHRIPAKRSLASHVGKGSGALADSVLAAVEFREEAVETDELLS